MCGRNGEGRGLFNPCVTHVLQKPNRAFSRRVFSYSSLPKGLSCDPKPEAFPGWLPPKHRDASQAAVQAGTGVCGPCKVEIQECKRSWGSSSCHSAGASKERSTFLGTWAQPPAALWEAAQSACCGDPTWSASACHHHLLAQIFQGGQQRDQQPSSVCWEQPPTLPTEPAGGLKLMAKNRLCPLNNTAPLLHGISSISSCGIFTAYSLLPGTVPFVAANRMIKECHRVVPVSPHPAQLWLSLEVTSHIPAHLCSVCWRKPTLLAEQRWCQHLLPCSWKSNLRQPQTCSQGEVLPSVPSSMPFWPPGLGVSPRSVAHTAFIPYTSQKGTHLSFPHQ